jgi:anti-sigma regulatory factor (Ser/Thr protein kinase)
MTHQDRDQFSRDGNNREVGELLQRAAAAQRQADVLCAQAAALVRGRHWAALTHDGVVRRRYAALPIAVPLARAAVVRLAVRADLAPRRLDGIRLAVTEAMTNAVVHAYPSRTGAIHLTAALTDGVLTVLIADDGVGPPALPGDAGPGWGWPLMHGSCDTLSVSRRAQGGTLVEMRWHIDVGPGTEPPDARPAAAEAGGA